LGIFAGRLAQVGPKSCAAPSAASISVADLAVDRGLQVGVFLARGAAADRTDLFQEILGFQEIALLDVPHPVILPGAHVVRVRRERLFVPDPGGFVIAELAIGIADVIGDFGAVVVTERPEGGDGRFVLAVEGERARRAIAVDELLLGFLLGLLLLRSLAGILLVGRGGRRGGCGPLGSGSPAASKGPAETARPNSSAAADIARRCGLAGMAAPLT
jgi:hypothetical protein